MTASTTTTSTTATDAAPPRRGYGALWAKVPREFGFLILTMPIAIIGLVVLSTVFFTGLGLVDDLRRHLPRWSPRSTSPADSARSSSSACGGPGAPRSADPCGARDGREQGFWRSAFAPFIDGHYWLYVLHTLVINPIVSIVTWSITIAWTSVALAGTTGWIWQPFIPERRPHASG